MEQQRANIGCQFKSQLLNVQSSYLNKELNILFYYFRKIYLFEKAQLEKEREKERALVSYGSLPNGWARLKAGAWNFSDPKGTVRAQALWASSVVFPSTLEVEQLGLKPVLIQDAGVAGTTLVSQHQLFVNETVLVNDH